MTTLGLGSGFKATQQPGIITSDTTPHIVAGAVAHINPADLTSWSTGAQFNDLSGNARHATQAGSTYQPDPTSTTFRGNRVIKFDGSNDYLTFGAQSLGNTGLYAHATSGNSFTTFVTFKLTKRQSMALAKSGNSAANRQFAIGSFDSGNDNLTVYVRGTGTTLKTSAINLALTVAFRYDLTTNTARAYVMGEGENTWTEVAVTIGSGASQATNILLGARTSTGTVDIMAGWIGETIIYDTALSDADMTQMAAYFAHHWMNKTPAARFIMLGASIELQAYGSSISDAQNRIGLDHNKYATVHNEGVYGWNTDNLQTNINTILAGYTVDGVPTYCTVDIGGNNVTANRPYSGDSSANKNNMISDIEYIMDAIIAKGFTPILVDISFRNYDGTTISNEAAGAKPYNDHIMHPLILEYSPEFSYADGHSFYNLYALMKNNYTTYFEADWIHPNGTGEAAIRQHFSDTIAKYIFTGVIPTDIA